MTDRYEWYMETKLDVAEMERDAAWSMVEQFKIQIRKMEKIIDAAIYHIDSDSLFSHNELVDVLTKYDQTLVEHLMRFGAKS